MGNLKLKASDAVFCCFVATFSCFLFGRKNSLLYCVGVFPVFYPLCIRGCLVHWSNRKVRIRYHQRSFLWNPTLRCIPGCTFGLPCFIGYLLTGIVVFCAAVQCPISSLSAVLCLLPACAVCFVHHQRAAFSTCSSCAGQLSVRSSAALTLNPHLNSAAGG